MTKRATITTLRNVRDHIRAIAEAAEKIPASADGAYWVALAGGIGAGVRISDLRSLATGYRLLTREIGTLADKQLERT